MQLNELTIKEARVGLREKSFSAREIVADCLAKIKERNPEVKAYLTTFEDDAMREATAADETLKSRGVSAPSLCGIPFGIKDNILVSGKTCTAGSKILENFRAPYDATAVKKLKNHGAVLLGKTNLDEFAMGSSTENSAFGPTKNPRDTSRVPGGSSGGSAAAVAGEMCLGALGSDTGGSIRQPASFCGIVGFKPTYGSVSRHGLIAMASSLDQIGPMAKAVEDAQIIFEAIAGGDDFDATAAKTNQRNKSDRDEPYSLKNKKIGVPQAYFKKGLDKNIEQKIKTALKNIEAAGAKIIEINLPHSAYALATYYMVVAAEVSANLARFDGIKYGYHGKNTENLLDVYTRSRAEGFGPEVKRRIMLGTYALSAGYYDAYYLKAQKVRKLIREDFKKAFAEVDFIMGPTAPNLPWRFGEKSHNPLEMYLEDIYTVAVNLAGLPALSLPAGVVPKNGVNLPVGMQIVGKWFSEKNLFDFAGAVEKIIVS